MEYKIFESSDTNVKKFVFEWGASAVTKKRNCRSSPLSLWRIREENSNLLFCTVWMSGWLYILWNRKVLCKES